MLKQKNNVFHYYCGSYDGNKKSGPSQDEEKSSYRATIQSHEITDLRPQYHQLRNLIFKSNKMCN